MFSKLFGKCFLFVFLMLNDDKKNSSHCLQNLCQHAFSFLKEHWEQNLRNFSWQYYLFPGFLNKRLLRGSLRRNIFFSYFVSGGLIQKIGIECSKRWVELNHTHNFWYFYTFILILISYSKLEVLIIIFILIILNNTYDFVLI